MDLCVCGLHGDLARDLLVCNCGVYNVFLVQQCVVALRTEIHSVFMWWCCCRDSYCRQEKRTSMNERVSLCACLFPLQPVTWGNFLHGAVVGSGFTAPPNNDPNTVFSYRACWHILANHSLVKITSGESSCPTPSSRPFLRCVSVSTQTTTAHCTRRRATTVW